MPQKAREKELNDKWITKVASTEDRHEGSNCMLSEILSVTFPLPLQHRSLS
jgi:hypothetical protein